MTTVGLYGARSRRKKEKKLLKQGLRGLSRYDLSLPPTHPDNIDAAAAQGLRWNSERKFFEDAQGATICDQDGNPPQ